MTDADAIAWGSGAAFTASADGVVDLASQAPVSGSYKDKDPMGLFWSMAPVADDPASGNFSARPPKTRASTVALTVTSDGQSIGHRSVTRTWMAPGEKARVLTLGADQVSGVLFTPPPGTPRRAGVLLFGGAEGGLSQAPAAALLAAHGYPALTVAYFGAPGLPANLLQIPLEYFITAGRILARQPGTDPAHVLVMGYSRGSEAALLLAEHFPALFHGAIVYSPSSDVNPAQSDDTQAAWTLGGRPVEPAPIAVDHVSGPVLAIAGGADNLWDSAGVREPDHFRTHPGRRPVPAPGPHLPRRGTLGRYSGARPARPARVTRGAWSA